MQFMLLYMVALQEKTRNDSYNANCVLFFMNANTNYCTILCLEMKKDYT